MNSQDVADYLQGHPEFFEEHAELLSSVSLSHPHRGRAISLSERQMITLREKNKGLEMRLAELVRFGQENDAIAERLHRWTGRLLLQRNARMLPEALTQALTDIFSVPQTAIRIWEAADDYAELECAVPVPVDLISLANSLKTPYVGVPTEAHASALLVMHDPNVQSMALIPLRRDNVHQAFGLILLASSDPRRFHSDMGTDFLARLGETASAALTRVLT